MNSDMGLMTAVTIVVALLVDFFFLPPLLLFLVGSKRKKAKQDLTIDDQGILDQRAPLNG
ncbi:hypothetical protein A3749_19300 [Oleiphilus sp. HI0078]|nr:hypothetical protein A3749_19300 [Oleiphilus sp. HI0078]